MMGDAARYSSEWVARAKKAEHRVVELQAELDQYRHGHVCVDGCRPNAHVAFHGRRLIEKLVSQLEEARDLLDASTLDRAELDTLRSEKATIRQDTLAWAVDRVRKLTDDPNIPALIQHLADELVASEMDEDVETVRDLREALEACGEEGDIEARAALEDHAREIATATLKWASTLDDDDRLFRLGTLADEIASGERDVPGVEPA